LHRNEFGVSPVSISRTTPPGLPATQDTVNATGRRTSKQVIHGITSLAAAPATGLAGYYAELTGESRIRSTGSGTRIKQILERHHADKMLIPALLNASS
jgi:hypothetical protein